MRRSKERLADDAPDGHWPAAQGKPLALAPVSPLFAADSRECTCLLVGTNGDLARRLVSEFPLFGVRPMLVTNAESIIRFVRTWKFDAIIVDGREPDSTRPILLGVLAALPATPVVLLSAKVDEPHVIADIERGATDVMSSDSSSRLIATKIKRLIWIASEPSKAGYPVIGPPRSLEVGSLSLDLSNGTGSVNGVPLQLTGRSYAVLSILAQRVDVVVDRITLSLHLGVSTMMGSRAFDMQVSHIRAALAQAGARDVFIETVYRRGYRLMLCALDQDGERVPAAPRHAVAASSRPEA